MKKLLCVLMATAMIFTVFSACSKPNENDKPTTEAPTTAKASTGFNTDTEGLMTPDEVMNDASTVDLNHYMEVEGLKKVEEKDDESATGTIGYYDKNGNIVYKKYIGYGEDSFDYYIKSNSGKDLTVKYILEDGKTIGVNAKCEDYTISFNKLDGSAKYGANDIYITSQKKYDSDFPKIAEYQYDGEKFNLVGNAFYGKDGYCRYSCTDGDNDKKVEDELILFEKIDTPQVNNDLAEMANDHRVLSVEFIEGQHTIKYTEDKNGKKSWFIDGEIYFVFNSKKGAEQFASKYGLTAKNSEYNDRYYTCTLTASIPIDKDYTDFYSFSSQDFNDCIFGRLHLSNNGTVLNITENDTNLVFY